MHPTEPPSGPRAGLNAPGIRRPVVVPKGDGLDARNRGAAPGLCGRGDLADAEPGSQSWGGPPRGQGRRGPRGGGRLLRVLRAGGGGQGTGTWTRRGGPAGARGSRERASARTRRTIRGRTTSGCEEDRTKVSNKRRSLKNDLEARELKRERGVEEGRREGEVSEMTQRHGRARECGPRGATRRSGERDTITLCRTFLFAPKIEGFFPRKCQRGNCSASLLSSGSRFTDFQTLCGRCYSSPCEPLALVDMRPETETLNTTPPSLCDMSEDIPQRIVSFLDPPSVYFLQSQARLSFAPTARGLLSRLATRRLEGVLADITSGSRRPPIEASYRRPFTVQICFPTRSATWTLMPLAALRFFSRALLWFSPSLARPGRTLTSTSSAPGRRHP